MCSERDETAGFIAVILQDDMLVSIFYISSIKGQYYIVIKAKPKEDIKHWNF